MARFADKVVVITGAASGIGEGAARRFVEEGATLVLGDIDKGALDQLVAELVGTVETRKTDVTDRTACEAAIDCWFNTALSKSDRGTATRSREPGGAK